MHVHGKTKDSVRWIKIVEASNDAQANQVIVPMINPMKSTKIGRNEPCPCESGKKYKKCCGR